MAVLEKIRVKFGLAASIIIALGLLSFIIDPSEIASAFNNMSSKYDVGEINGKSVSYTDFQEDIQKFTTINEMMTGASAQSSEQQAQIRDAAWQDLVYRYLFIKKAHAAGVYVGEDELVDLTSGNSVSPILSQFFADQNGNFSKDNLVKFVQSIDADQTGRTKTFWNYLQNTILNNQYFQKYSSLLSQSSIVTPLMVKKQLEENNTTADVDFVMVPAGITVDSTIVVSDAEIKDYYNSHKNLFKQTASRDIEYVVFEVTPSAEDLAATAEKIEALRSDFASTDKVKSFLTSNSSRAYSDYFYKKGELNTVSPDIESFVWEGEGEVSPVINNGNNYFVARVMDTKMVPDSAYVKHILLQGEKADAEADSLMGVLKSGESFTSVAALNSADKSSSADGELGNIGWMTQTYMIPGFESVLTAETGKPYIIKTQYGTHIVLVDKKSKPIEKKQVAILEKEAVASNETINDTYSKANKFVTLAAGSLDNYKKAVDTLGVYSHPVNHMAEGTDKLGSIDNAKEVSRWAFENKVGKVSDIITVDNNFFIIAANTGIHKAGYAEVNEVASYIKEYLSSEKALDKKAAEVGEKIKGMTDINAIAEKLNTSVSSQSGIAFSSLNSQGTDPKFLGAVAAAPQGKICGPVAGSIGVYVFDVKSRDTGAFYTEADAKTRNSQMAQYANQMIIPVMMQDADVKDDRARFY